jgi:hypothetical protein
MGQLRVSAMVKGDLVELRAKTDDDEDVLYRIAADLGTWGPGRSAHPPPLRR